MGDDKLAMLIDETADDTAMFIFQILDLDYDDPANRQIAMLVRKRVCLAIHECIVKFRLGLRD